jgi:hypothetical protein
MTHNFADRIPKPIRHLGDYREGVTTAEAAIDNRVLRFLWRGQQTSATIINYLKAEPELVRVRLERLAEWGLVEMETTVQTGSFRVGLTADGRQQADRLRAKIQAEVMATAQEGHLS